VGKTHNLMFKTDESQGMYIECRAISRNLKLGVIDKCLGWCKHACVKPKFTLKTLKSEKKTLRKH